MRFNRFMTRTAMAVTVAISSAQAGTMPTAAQANVDRAALLQAGASQQQSVYIVEVKGKTGIEKAEELGELLPARQSVSLSSNRYNAMSAKMQAYNQNLTAFHQQLAQQNAAGEMLYSYTHTFNGFSAKMTASQAEALRQNPNVIGVWLDEAEQMTTSNTPAFLGLTGPGGQHTLGIKGDDVVIGVIDSGIWPEHPSFADDGSYAPLPGWAGICDSGEDPAFTCNNKLIGARYFKSAFEASYAIQPTEFISPRDADNHGTHTSSTAAGNEGVTAVFNGTPVATVSGIAPRARVAMYKACWNSTYVSPAGVNERGCFYGDTMAAIDQAVADGVDVINYSISGSVSDLTTLGAAAKLRAAQAGVFVAVSAGNNGPAAETVGTPAPWVTSVAASTYDGFSIANGIEVTAGTLQGTYVAVEGTRSVPLAQTGEITADTVVATPLLACSALTNAAEIAGKFALIQRGTCGFDIKIAAAEAAGAVGVIVYNNVAGAPTPMGGTGSFGIPSVMTTLAAGTAFNAEITGGGAVNIKMSPSVFVDDVVEVGNLMASFSSRGPNKATYDIIKPDITAPGVKILAGASSQPMFGAQGVSFVYLQGTSMSSPHIAGMAALLKGEHPDWTPAMIKSALMTTARQNVLKENGVTPADPFDFGAGHAAPVSARDPGLTYDIANLDYFAFLCGIGNSNFVQSASGYTCAAFVNAGYNTDPTQLNLPSIAIAELSQAETVLREVTDVTGDASSYSISVQAPAGVTVTVKTQNALGDLVPGNIVNVAANGKATYALTFTPTAAAVIDAWAFGAVTLSDGVHTVRSPIAVKVIPLDAIEAPDKVSTSVPAKSGRVTFPVLFNYSGLTSSSMVGLTAPAGSSGTVSQDANSSFTFNEAGLGFHAFTIPAGTRLLRFSLYDALSSVPGADLDMYVYRCIAYSCSAVGTSALDGGNESVTLRDPLPADNSAVGDFYLVFVHGYNLLGAASANYTMPLWIVNSSSSNSRIVASSRGIAGRSNNVTLMTSNLTASPFPYLGVMMFKDADGAEQASTMLEITAQ